MKPLKSDIDQRKFLSSYDLVIALLSLLSLLACDDRSRSPQIFQKLESAHTNITFKNDIIEDDVNNFLTFSNIYNGSGVGIGDFNSDGLPDIYFGGGLETSRLYLNQGGFKFKDITNSAGVTTDRWIAGVAVVDINADGWDDIYLSVTGEGPPDKLKNLLFINNGHPKGRSSDEITFTESAEGFGIDEEAHCTQANFFDYDRDGDLDLFLIVNPPDLKREPVNLIRPKLVDGSASSTDILFRNNTIDNGVAAATQDLVPFTNVSKEAGILIEGYSLGCNVSDLNDDGWPDIYITNDFMSNDILYINNRDGTFSNRAATMLKHTSYASMGLDVADVDNDGLPDIYALDMLPEDNYRQKTMVLTGDYDRFQRALDMGYEPQYTRNTLQLNNGDGSFSEVGQLYNIHKTDWSWSALLADFDNDGFKDLFVTNGYKRDLGDLDYMMSPDPNMFGSAEAKLERKLARIMEQPGAMVPNYVFKNDSGRTFTEKTQDWGMNEPSFSCGAAFADFDLDGDLDIVVNNVGQEAFVYQNTSNELTQSHYLQIKLEGSPTNRHAFGTKVWLYYDDQMQFAEQVIYRGYESSMDPTLHFGLGEVSEIDSLRITFPNGRSIVQKNIAADTVLIITHAYATMEVDVPSEMPEAGFIEEVPSSYGINYLHSEDIQVDFKDQPLLPHQHSQLGPALAKGDVNQDGLEDLFIGGAAGYPATLLLQTEDGKFDVIRWAMDSIFEDTNALFFDVDQDGDPDLYVCSGGVVNSERPDIYQDRLYLNNGQGDFSRIEKALPRMQTSTKALAAADVDLDGDLDLFVGGRVSPGEYPDIPQSYLLENRNGIFVDVTEERAAQLEQIGMVTDALWTDFDNDNDPDLMLVGEWMPITMLENENGNLTSLSCIEFSEGWWNTLAEGDFDDDGDLDYLAGNLGWNTNYRASTKEPFSLYANDFDNDGSIDPVLCQFIEGVEQAIPTRDKLIEQIPAIARRFDTYQKYAETPFEDVFRGSEWEGVQIYRSHLFASSYIENLGNGQFKLKQLPMELQMAPINKFLVQDVNGDGHLDALVVGNDYSTEITIGRYDAFTGGVLLGNGNGEFDFRQGANSGFLADKNAQNLIALKLGTGKETLFVVGNNSDSLQVFKSSRFVVQ